MYSYVGLIHPKHIETFTGSPSKIIHKWYMMVYLWLLDIYLQKHPKQISVIHVNICHTLTLHGGNNTTIPSTLNHIHWLNPNQNVDPNTFFFTIKDNKSLKKVSGIWGSAKGGGAPLGRWSQHPLLRRKPWGRGSLQADGDIFPTGASRGSSQNQLYMFILVLVGVLYSN